jgi:hypothetical protein
MADEVDMAQEHSEKHEAYRIKEVQAIAQKIPVGEAGECNLCGEHNPRLVCGNCSPCRDKYKLP